MRQVSENIKFTDFKVPYYDSGPGALADLVHKIKAYGGKSLSAEETKTLSYNKSSVRKIFRSVYSSEPLPSFLQPSSTKIPSQSSHHQKLIEDNGNDAVKRAAGTNNGLQVAIAKSTDNKKQNTDTKKGTELFRIHNGETQETGSKCESKPNEQKSSTSTVVSPDETQTKGSKKLII
ncbi:hypothetical protein TRICI_004675 [Trichomonascus ciferrii]|uniref:Uncharacterized protein n=1 Tax=Trichomonascus ciferrii TaxID=44093 RepID=A0A642V078_9ASCO|nr:hypothetical protein TRICI_004675 [Trichomonascus ciferrii]